MRSRPMSMTLNVWMDGPIGTKFLNGIPRAYAIGLLDFYRPTRNYGIMVSRLGPQS